MRIFLALLSIGFSLGFSMGSFSSEASTVTTEVPDFTIHHQYESARAEGMGNAFTAVADDYSAMFYNPAALANFEEGEMNFGLGVMADKDVYGFYTGLKNASGTTDANGSNAQALSDFLTSKYGKHFSARAPTLSWIWTRPRWSIAVIPADLSLELGIHQAITPAAAVIATQDTTIAYGRGWNIPVSSGKLAIGGMLKTIYRAYFNRFISSADLALNSNVIKASDAAEGFTADGDIGVLYSFHVPKSGFFHMIRPSVGATVHNIANYGFTSNFHVIDKNSLQPPSDQRRFDVGTKFELPDWWIFKTRFAMDERDIGHDNWTFVKGSHAGLEFLWKLYGWWQGGWRVGISQGYLSAGFSAKLGIFALDLVTYGEEIGPSGSSQSNRRYAMRAALDF
jgi:hypothetical protein